jgi:hypothetical protein
MRDYDTRVIPHDPNSLRHLALFELESYDSRVVVALGGAPHEGSCVAATSRTRATLNDRRAQKRRKSVSPCGVYWSAG